MSEPRRVRLSPGDARLAARQHRMDVYHKWIITELADRCEDAEAERDLVAHRLQAVRGLADNALLALSHAWPYDGEQGRELRLARPELCAATLAMIWHAEDAVCRRDEDEGHCDTDYIHAIRLENRALLARAERAEAELRRLAAIDSFPDLLIALRAVRDSLPGG